MSLIPEARPASPPDYLVAGGLIFRELDEPYLTAWGSDWKEKIPSYLRCLYELRRNHPAPQQQRLIVLADVFPHEYNLGYHDIAQSIVKSVNGHPISSIRDMEEAFKTPSGGVHIIEFMPSYEMTKIILDADSFERATAEIMEQYEIPSRIRMH